MAKKQAEADEIAAVEIYNHIMNPGTPLYERFKFFVIMYNKKVKKGIFDEKLAVKGFLNLVNAGWSSYKKEYYEPESKATLDMATKQVMAKLLLKEYNANWKGKPVPGQKGKANEAFKPKKFNVEIRFLEKAPGETTKNKKDIQNFNYDKNGIESAGSTIYGYITYMPEAGDIDYYKFRGWNVLVDSKVDQKTRDAIHDKILESKALKPYRGVMQFPGVYSNPAKNKNKAVPAKIKAIFDEIEQKISSGDILDTDDLKSEVRKKLNTFALITSTGGDRYQEGINIQPFNKDWMEVVYFVSDVTGETFPVKKVFANVKKNVTAAYNADHKPNKSEDDEESEYEGPVDDDIIMMQDGDVIIYSQGSGYNSIGNFTDDFHEDKAEMWEAIFVSMNERQYWGNVWHEQERSDPELVTDMPKIKFLKLKQLKTPAQALEALKQSGAEDTSEENAKTDVGEFVLIDDTLVKAPFNLRVEKGDKDAAKYGKQKVFFVINGQDDKTQAAGWLYKGDFYLLPGKWQDIVEGLNNAKLGTGKKSKKAKNKAVGHPTKPHGPHGMQLYMDANETGDGGAYIGEVTENGDVRFTVIEKFTPEITGTGLKVQVSEIEVLHEDATDLTNYNVQQVISQIAGMDKTKWLALDPERRAYLLASGNPFGLEQYWQNDPREYPSVSKTLKEEGLLDYKDDLGF